MGSMTINIRRIIMGFLEKILNRPENERAFLLIPVGFPADDAKVPVLNKKQFDDYAVIY